MFPPVLTLLGHVHMPLPGQGRPSAAVKGRTSRFQLPELVQVTNEKWKENAGKKPEMYKGTKRFCGLFVCLFMVGSHRGSVFQGKRPVNISANVGNGWKALSSSSCHRRGRSAWGPYEPSWETVYPWAEIPRPASTCPPGPTWILGKSLQDPSIPIPAKTTTLKAKLIRVFSQWLILIKTRFIPNIKNLFYKRDIIFLCIEASYNPYYYNNNNYNQNVHWLGNWRKR